MIADTYKVLLEGWFKKKAMAAWRNRNGAHVVWLHHSADPSKDDLWASDFSKTFPGGRTGGAWRSEMDGDADAFAGGLVYPDFQPASHIIPYFDPPAEWVSYRVIDPGLDNPLACILVCLDPNTECLIQYGEHYQAGWSEIDRHAQRIKAMTGKHRVQYTLIDSSAFAKTLAGGGTSVADLFAQHGIAVSPARRVAHKRELIPAVAELMRVDDRGEPRMKVMDNCVHTIAELREYRWKPSPHEDRNNPDEPVDFNDHACDCWGYLAAAVDPRRAASSVRGLDPLAPWYVGRDRKRLAADVARLHHAARDHSMEEP